MNYKYKIKQFLRTQQKKSPPIGRLIGILKDNLFKLLNYKSQ
jgi:hypothetical protein